MKKTQFACTLIAALMLTSIVACSATPTRESTGQYVDDTTITAEVKAAILNEATLKVTEINVETYKGTVQLSGFVRSEENIITAVQVTRRIKGVVAVKNDMRLK